MRAMREREQKEGQREIWRHKIVRQEGFPDGPEVKASPSSAGVQV